MPIRPFGKEIKWRLRIQFMMVMVVFECVLVTAIILISTAEMKAALASMQPKLCFLGAVALLAGWLASLFLARRVTRPINALAKSVDAIFNSDHELPMEIGGNDEIGCLGKRFSVMQQVKEHIRLINDSNARLKLSNEQLHHEIVERRRIEAELEKHGYDLEALVEERTTKLQLANEQLQYEIAERRQAEKEARRAKEIAEATSHAKSQFLASMSHEIRTPMNSVLGIAELLLRTQLTERQREQVTMIRSSGQLLLHIINDILDLSKIEAGRLELEVIDFNLHQTVESLVELFVEPAQRKKLQLACLIAGDVQSLWRGDDNRLRQILVNLIGNAVKFTEEGEIVVKVSTIDDQGDRAVIRFEVSDTGIGLFSENKTRIFDPFTQADVTTERQYGGTGLGLSICKQLVERMGGEIGVESEFGKGAKFWFTLCLEKGCDNADGALLATEGMKNRNLLLVDDNTTRQVILHHGSILPEEDGVQSCSGRILLAEDNPVNQKMTLAMLETFNCRADVALNGIEALDALADKAYDLVLMDCQMPEMDGFAATKAIREQEKLESSQFEHPGAQPLHLPIIALTAHAMSGVRQKCLEAGMDDYLSKPFSLSQLHAVLMRWLPGKLVADKKSSSSASDASDAISPVPAESGLPSAPPINTNVLNGLQEELKRMGASKIFDKTIRIYLETSPTYIQALREAVSRKDTSTILRVAHTFKSSNGNLGAEELAMLCRDMEKMARENRTEKVEALLSVIDAEYKRVADALATELRKSD